MRGRLIGAALVAAVLMACGGQGGDDQTTDEPMEEMVPADTMPMTPDTGMTGDTMMARDTVM